MTNTDSSSALISSSADSSHGQQDAGSDRSNPEESESSNEPTDLSRYVLILGNFTNLPDVATLSENSRYLFAPPKEDQNWKGSVIGQTRLPFLALEFGKHMYSPEGWVIGSSSDSDECDVQLTADRENLGISTRHLRVDVDEVSKCPRFTLLSSQNPLRIIIHEKSGDRKVFLTHGIPVKIEESDSITVDFGTSSFLAWRPNLEFLEKVRYRQRCETLFNEYIESVPTFPSLGRLSRAETVAVRFGQDGAVYRRDGMSYIGKGAHATVYRVVEMNSGKHYAAKEPYYKTSDSTSETLKRIKRLGAEYNKLVALKHPHIVEAVELLLIENDRHLPPWLIMEYIEDNLENMRCYMSGDASLSILPHIFDGVAFMHSKNYVHRDIKLSNILIKWVNKKPVAKFADVGTMKEDEGLKTFTGTPEYMAPECWTPLPQYNKEVDMWSIGLVLLQLFTRWDPRTDKAWVHGPHCKVNKMGFTVWIHDVITPLIATAKPEPVRDLLTGLLRESPADRWNATTCQTWVREYITPLTHDASHAGPLPRRDSYLPAPGLDDDDDRRRKIRSPHPTLDSVRAAQHVSVNHDDIDDLPDTLPWGAARVPEKEDGGDSCTL
ncbi:hypothetical protein ACEQ8H_003290 [Pleosporales sp. CAS-2024a]